MKQCLIWELFIKILKMMKKLENIIKKQYKINSKIVKAFMA